MIIDMHMHECTYSSDSILELKHMVQLAQERGLEGICITDHDSMGLQEEAEKYSKKIGFPIFIGVEYYSLDGDIVAFGLDSLPRGRISAQDFIDYVQASNGICIAAHPYRHNNRGLGDKLYTLQGLDGIEAYNGSTRAEDNFKALAACMKLNIQPVGVSDCHAPNRLGKFATCIPDTVSNVQELILSFKKNASYPLILQDNNYIDLREREFIKAI